MSDELILVTHQGLCCCVLSSARPTPVPGGRDSPPRMLPLASSRPIIGLLATLQISKVAAGERHRQARPFFWKPAGLCALQCPEAHACTNRLGYGMDLPSGLAALMASHPVP